MADRERNDDPLRDDDNYYARDSQAPGAATSRPSSKKWWLLLGCLPLGLLVVCGGGCAAVFAFIFGLIKSSEPYQLSLSRAQADPQVTEALGQPIEPGFFPQGSINLNGDAGDADITYTISGPKGSATVHVAGTKAAGKWTYSTMEARLSSGEVIDLNEAAPGDAPQ
jgi:hypothetical protein